MSPISRGSAPSKGEVWWVAFDPSLGGEMRKTRRVVVSNDVANAVLNRVQVVPLTSNVDRLYPSEAFVRLGRDRRKAMADQMTTASKLRLRGPFGRSSADDMRAVEAAIKLHLALS